MIMTHRTNWQVLRTHDPIPGDVAGIRQAASRYQAVSTNIDDANRTLGQIVSGNIQDYWVSQAIDAIRDSAKTVMEGLQKAKGRYTVAAQQLKNYADSLDTAQTQADDAEARAQAAKQAQQTAQQNLNSYNNIVSGLQHTQSSYNNYSGDPAGAPTPQQVSQNSACLSRYRNLAADASSDLAAATNALNAASADLDRTIAVINTAAESAASAIRAQINDDGLNDTFWSTWGQAIADFIAAVATDIGSMVWNALSDLFNGLKAFIEGIIACVGDAITGNFDKLVEDAKATLAAAAQMMDGLSSILSLLAIALPGLGEIALAITLASAVIDLVSQLANDKLTPAKLVGDVLKGGLAFVPSAGDSAAAAGGLEKGSQEAINEALRVNLTAGGRAINLTTSYIGDVGSNVIGLEMGQPWPGPAGGMFSSLNQGASMGPLATWANTPIISTSLTGGPIPGTFNLSIGGGNSLINLPSFTSPVSFTPFVLPVAPFVVPFVSPVAR